MKQIFLWLWAAPGSLPGLVMGGLALATGGTVQKHGRVLEFYGGGIDWMFGHLPMGRRPSAMTLGHVILGRSRSAMDVAREHEMVHVRQYERWGPAFLPAYLYFWLVLTLRGKNGYLDNPFEREAYGH